MGASPECSAKRAAHESWRLCFLSSCPSTASRDREETVAYRSAFDEQSRFHDNGVTEICCRIAAPPSFNYAPESNNGFCSAIFDYA
jgi:hypothetical protein